MNEFALLEELRHRMHSRKEAGVTDFDRGYDVCLIHLDMEIDKLEFIFEDAKEEK